MNTLTIFLYFADILGNVSYALKLISFLLMSGIGACLLIGGMAFLDAQGEAAKGWKNFISNSLSWLWAVVIIYLLSSIIPSQDTMYLMAGSEVGEMVVTSDAAKEVINKVSLAIDQMLKGTSP